MTPLPDLLRRHPETRFQADEAFIGLAGETVAHLVPEYSNLLVTRTLSKAHSLAGFRIGYGISPEPIADDLNNHNDVYPLARPSQAAAIATLQHENVIRKRSVQLHAWAEALAAELRALGVHAYQAETYFSRADFAPHDTAHLAEALKVQGILIKPLNAPMLGDGFMRITTALPKENICFPGAIKELLAISSNKAINTGAGDKPTRAG